LFWRIAIFAGMAAHVAAGTAHADMSVLSAFFGGEGVAPTARPSGLVVFSGQETDQASRRFSGGFKLRPLRLFGQDRFILTGAISGGAWRETGALRLMRESDSQNTRFHILGGSEFRLWGGDLGVVAGPELFREAAVDPRGRLLRQEKRVGVRLQLDWWRQPTPATLLTANLAAGTAKRDLWSRASIGWRVGGAESSWGFIGPEASFSAYPGGARARIGAHWTEFGYRGYRFRVV
jgi:hypothetical protein